MHCYKGNRNLQRGEYRHSEKHFEEGSIVGFADAVVEPGAMMIEVRDASIARLAVLGMLQDMRFANIAVKLILVHVEVNDIVSSRLGFSLQIHRRVSRVDNRCQIAVVGNNYE